MSVYTYILFLAVLIIVAIPFFLTARSNKRLIKYIQGTFGKKPKYLDYELKSIKSYHEYIVKFTDTSNQIDAITWDDLNMDAVFKRINVCKTSVGEEYLYQALHEVNFDTSNLEKREKLITFFDKNPDNRIKIQLFLTKLGKQDFNGLSSFIFDSKSKMLENSWLYNILALLPIVFGGLIFVSADIGIIFLILSILANAVLYFRLKLSLEKEISVIRYFSSLLFCCWQMLKIDDSDLFLLLSGLRENFDVFKSIKGNVSNSARNGMSPIDFLADYYKMIFLTDIRKYNRVINKITKEHEAFHCLYKQFGEIDIALSVLSFRKSLKDYCMPDYAEENSVKFTELYHPLLEKPITNSGEITRNSIVSGPNASGKSTFIKALAINSIFAQSINTCTAKHYIIRHSLVMTSMAVRDDILEGDSYFVTEIKSLKRVLDKMEEVPVTCFIDEILRGTNTIERIAASSSILKYLVDKDCLCIVASHDIELTKIMEKVCENYHFSEKVGSEGVSFDFKLKMGAANTKNAIRLLGYMEYDKKIVEEANKRVSGFIETGLWEKA